LRNASSRQLSRKRTSHHTKESLISSHGVAARKVEQTPPIGNRQRF
jgi:hypothetical protein